MTQTKQQFLEKFEEVLDTARANMRTDGERLFNSGAVDPADYADDYRLPKLILVAVLLDEADNWKPLKENKKAHRTINNLRHF